MDKTTADAGGGVDSDATDSPNLEFVSDSFQSSKVSAEDIKQGMKMLDVTDKSATVPSLPLLSPSKIAEMITRPPPGYPVRPPGISQPVAPGTISMFPAISQPPPLEVADPHTPIINGVLDAVVKEMKLVIKNDVSKKIIENTAFKRFDQWWDEQVHKEKFKTQSDDPNITPEKVQAPASSSIEALLDPNCSNTDLASFRRGLKATMPRMPSFGKKYIKLLSFPPLDDKDSKKAEESDSDMLITSESDSESDAENSTELGRRSVVFSSEEEEEQNSQKCESERDDVSSSAEESSGTEWDSEESVNEEVVLAQNIREDKVVAVPSNKKPVKTSFKGVLGDSQRNEHKTEPVKIEISDLDDLSKSEIDPREIDEVKKKSTNLVPKEPGASAEPKILGETVCNNDSKSIVGDGRREKEKIKTTVVDEAMEIDFPETKAPYDTVQEASQEFSHLDSSEAFMNLALWYSAFDPQDIAETATKEADSINKSNAKKIDEQTNDLTNNELDFDSETTLSAEESKIYENKNGEEEYISSLEEYDGNHVPLVIHEHSYCVPKSIKTAKLQSILNATKKSSDKTSKKTDSLLGNDNKFIKIRDASPPLMKLESPIKVAPKKKTKVKKMPSTRTSYKENYGQVEQTFESPLTYAGFTFPKRSLVEDMRVLYDFLKNGLDQEDAMYLKNSYEALLQDDVQGFWVNDTHWVDCPTSIPTPLQKKVDSTKTNLSGCARCEAWSPKSEVFPYKRSRFPRSCARCIGYYKLSVKEKALAYKCAFPSSEMDGEQGAHAQMEKVTPNVSATPSDGILCRVQTSRESIQLTKDDFKTLSDENRLNDNIMNFYLVLLEKRSQEEDGFPSLYCYSTFFYSKLKKEGPSKGLLRWTRKTDIFSKDILIVPLHLESLNHWALLVVDNRTKKMIYLDSLGRGESQCLEIFENYLIAEMLDKKQIIQVDNIYSFEVPQDIPKQNNIYDCGVFVLKYAAYISRDAPLTFLQEDMPYFRQRMVYELLEKEVF